MEISLPKNGIIAEQHIDIDKSVMMIYGYNNSGKTTLLKTIDQTIDKKMMKSIMEGKQEIPSIYIPANRLFVKPSKTEKIWNFKDAEDFLAMFFRNNQRHVCEISI